MLKRSLPGRLAAHQQIGDLLDNTVEPSVWKTTGLVRTQSRPGVVIVELHQLSLRPHFGGEARRQDSPRRVVPELAPCGVDDLDLELGVGGCLCSKDRDKLLSIKRSGQSAGARHDHGKFGPMEHNRYCTHAYAGRLVVTTEMNMDAYRTFKRSRAKLEGTILPCRSASICDFRRSTSRYSASVRSAVGLLLSGTA